MAALGKLIAGVAHEVNTPTGVINSSIDVSQRAIAKIVYEMSRTATAAEAGENRELQRYLAVLRDNNQNAREAANRIAKIVENLRSFARLDEAEFQPAIDIQEGLESTLGLIEPQLGDRIQVLKRFEDIPKIAGYPNQLNQHFMTLIVNAAEAIEEEGTVTISTSKNQNKVCIDISDTGRGIPPERLGHIFEVGFSQKGPRMRMHAGLANCYAIVQKHHGEITVESEIGKGTLFRTILPAH
jgi:signal transduction histidine kinase